MQKDASYGSATTRFSNVNLTHWRMGLEVIVITGAVLLLGYYVNPRDPFFLKSVFPWTWLASILIALRYGIGPAVLSLVIIVAVLFLTLSFLTPNGATLETTAYRLYILSGFIVTLLIGFFSSAWIAHGRRIEQLNRYMHDRLEHLSRAYYLVRLSHDHLEQSFISKPVTLRSTLNKLRALLRDSNGHLTANSGQRLLALLNQYCPMQRAGLYMCDDKKFKLAPLAQLGKMSSLNIEDPLIARAFTEREITYHAVNVLGENPKNHYLAAAPLITSEGKLLGLLAICDMPFETLNEENLQALSILIAYFADEACANAKAHTFLQQYPDCPPLFATEMYKLVYLKKRIRIDSALVAIVLNPDERRDSITIELQRQQRGVDYSWLHCESQQSILFILMPFAGPNTVAGFLQRIGEFLQSQFGIKLGEDSVFTRQLQLYNATPHKIVAKLLSYVSSSQ